MKIIMILHSKTGVTLNLADSLRDRLVQDGHDVHRTLLETAEPISDNPRPNTVYKFTNLPDLSDADIVMFGGPVWAFRPSPVIRQAVRELGTKLKGKTVLPFLTMGFPFAWMAGNSSLQGLRRLCADFGAKTLQGIVLTGRQKNKPECHQALAETVSQRLNV